MDALPDRIETDRLVLRQWTPDDVEVLTAAIVESRDHLLPWMPWAEAEPVSGDQRTKMIDEWRRAWEGGGDAVYGVFLGDLVIGGCGLHDRRGPGVLEIGYWLHVDHTGRGYATELAAALTMAAFERPAIERVEIHHDRGNTASGAVPRRLGYTFVGEQSDDSPVAGQDGVDWTWSIDRESWGAGPAVADSGS